MVFGSLFAPVIHILRQRYLCEAIGVRVQLRLLRLHMSRPNVAAERALQRLAAKPNDTERLSEECLQVLRNLSQYQAAPDLCTPACLPFGLRWRG